MKVNFNFWTILIAFGLTALPITGQETNAQEKKIISLDDAKTVSEVENWISSSLEEIITQYRRGVQKAQELQVEGGEKIIKIAQNDKDKKKGYKYKYDALSQLTRVGGDEGKKYKEELDNFIKELEANDKFSSIVNDTRFQESIGRTRLQNKTDFEKFKKELKTWLNKPTVTHNLVISSGLRRAKSYANTVKDDAEFFTKFVDELTDFIKSSENTLDDNTKKELTEQIDIFIQTSKGNNVVSRGNDLQLYGKTIDNKDFNWESLRGKYVIVKFTATWCVPCKAEIPGLISAYEKYKDKGLEIISVYIWERGDDTNKIVEDVKKLAKEEKITWKIVSEELTAKAKKPKQGDFYAIRAVPTILLIDKNGKIIDANIQGQRLQDKLEEIFK
ncbi:MAG: TlpA family protein disulfide reductase [Planctomycetaceae bacterium]|jgi:thiol-disulfide isomerase/thioredoxin|nr:TlpA family protein disulfide reductase [Planctomycetaceae bacterium]